MSSSLLLIILKSASMMEPNPSFRHEKSNSNLLAMSLFVFFGEIGVDSFLGVSFGELIIPINNKPPRIIPTQCTTLSFFNDFPQPGHFLTDLDTCLPQCVQVVNRLSLGMLLFLPLHLT